MDYQVTLSTFLIIPQSEDDTVNEKWTASRIFEFRSTQSKFEDSYSKVYRYVVTTIIQESDC